jgi:hypothetical protein
MLTQFKIALRNGNLRNVAFVVGILLKVPVGNCIKYGGHLNAELFSSLCPQTPCIDVFFCGLLNDVGGGIGCWTVQCSGGVVNGEIGSGVS